jgi:sulfotransferase famil protein
MKPVDVAPAENVRVPPEEPFARHVARRAVVLDDLRILFLPNPKSGCTSMLWLLAELAGIPLERFSNSTLPEVSPALTVHDMALWGPGYRLSDYGDEERERILGEGGWLRFSIVRHPATRLWSAWQSKLLLREPRFVDLFGEEPWFPRLPDEPAHLVEDFRLFVQALPRGTARDVHWAAQRDLLAQLPLGHIGRIERLSDSLAVLREHVGDERMPATPERENRSSLPLPPHAYENEDTRAALDEFYRADFEEYNYEPLPASSDESEVSAWEDRVAPLLPLLRDAIEKHARIGQLNRVAGRVPSLERQINKRSIAKGRRLHAPVLTNLEEYADFNIHWAWAETRPRPGFTAVVRAKNEARTLPWTLPPLLRAVERVIVVDNGSTDGTAETARQVAAEAGAADRIELHSYPFSVARCGEEHLSVAAESVHNLSYFYNWSFSRVETAYALKWDADMVLTDSAVQVLQDLAWELEAVETIVKIPRYPLYIADEQRAYLDLGMWNCEPWAWPNREGYTFVKALEWEQPLWPSSTPTLTFPDWSCVELKHLDVDEFAHWSATDFDESARTRRKRREWHVFNALANGEPPPREVVAIEAPEGSNVVDYVRSDWLPAKASERSPFGDRLLRRLTA